MNVFSGAGHQFNLRYHGDLTWLRHTEKWLSAQHNQLNCWSLSSSLHNIHFLTVEITRNPHLQLYPDLQQNKTYFITIYSTSGIIRQFLFSFLSLTKIVCAAVKHNLLTYCRWLLFLIHCSYVLSRCSCSTCLPCCPCPPSLPSGSPFWISWTNTCMQDPVTYWWRWYQKSQFLWKQLNVC